MKRKKSSYLREMLSIAQELQESGLRNKARRIRSVVTSLRRRK